MSSDIVLTALWGLKTVEGDEVPFGKDQIKLILSAQLFLLKMILCINCSPYNVFAFVNLELHSSKSWEPCVFVTAQAYDFSRTELVQQIVSYRVICRLSGRRCTRKWTHQPIWRLQLNCFSSRTVYAGARCHQNGRRPSSLHLRWRRNRLARVMGPRSQVPGPNERDGHAHADDSRPWIFRCDARAEQSASWMSLLLQPDLRVHMSRYAFNLVAFSKTVVIHV